jgi:MFS family permease
MDGATTDLGAPWVDRGVWVATAAPSTATRPVASGSLSTDDAPRPELPSARSVLGQRSPLLFLMVVTTTTMASIAQVTALGVQVFALTGRELDLGLLGLAEFAPALLLAVPAGALADRFDRRLMMGVGLAGEVASSLGLAAVTARGSATFGTLLGLVVLFGVFRALTAPAARALPATLVAPEALPRIVPLFSASWQFGLIAGPVLGGFLYSVDPAYPYLAAAALVAVGIVALPFVALHPSAAADPDAGPRTRPSLREALDGLRVIRRTPVLFGAISLDLFAVLFGGAVALLPAIAKDRLGVDATGLGWLRAAGGMGAALTTVVLAWRPFTRHVGRVLLLAVGVFGVATILLGLTTSFAVAFVALAVLSGADAVSVYVRATLVPLITADEYRGRVLAVENVFIGASNELGAFESGVAGQILGAPGAIVLGGAATLVVVVIWWFRFTPLRDVDRFDDIAPGSVRPDG